MNKQNIKNYGQMKYIEREIEILEEMKKNNKQLIQYIGYEEDKVNFYLKF